MEACPSELDILQLVRGELDSSIVESLLVHTDACESCALVVAEAGLAISAQAGDTITHVGQREECGPFAAGGLIARRYRIQARVGQGGMGSVYSATDEELGERIALKTIAPMLACDPLLVEHFKRELRLARQVSHPNVCKTLEFGRHELETGVSQCFFTMQFIDGVTLRRRLRDDEAFELDDALGMVRDLALGLQAIHEQSIVHRDIKPDNVMLASGSPDGKLVPLWLDFGVARVDLRESVSLGVLAGTPDYAAPELLRGKVATRASDLYALGLVLYEVLVGHLPFSHARSFSEAVERRYLVPAAPSSFRTGLPAALDQLVLECLAEAPQHRPSSARHVADRLGAIQAGLSGGHAEVAAVEQKPAPRRWPWLAATTAIALIGAVFAKDHSPQVPAASSPSAQAQLELSPPLMRPSPEPSESASEVPRAPTAPAPAASIMQPLRARPVRARPVESTPTAPTATPHSVSDFGGRR
jgi:eukaryotic-like serine/threonine-protein kinase